MMATSPVGGVPKDAIPTSRLREGTAAMLTVQYKPMNDDSIFSDDDWDSQP